MIKKGIVLAGGAGTRLYPATVAICKQLLPLYDKPMIYYPLSILMLAGIREIMIISTPLDLPLFKRLLGDGSKWGLKFEYRVQEKPKGIAQAIIIAKDFIINEKVALILGDNLFFGAGLKETLKKAVKLKQGATIFGYWVKDPKRYGVVEFDFEKSFKVLSLEEKPDNPKSNYAVPGLYFYDESVLDRVLSLKPSKRGELEINDLNQSYLDDQLLNLKVLGRGTAWLDTGTHESFLAASNFVSAIEERQGLKIGCLEELAFFNGWITADDLIKLASELKNSSYGQYLLSLLERKLF